MTEYPPLGNYGPNNMDLPDISTGWHIFADGNMWCAVGPVFENLQENTAGFGSTPPYAYQALKSAFRYRHSPLLPPFEDFHIHQPTVKPDAK